jgi:hypothetical protein
MGGATFIDLLGRFNGSFVTASHWDGAFGRPGGFGSQLFSQTSQYVDCGHVPLDSNNWTLAAWLRPSLGATGAIRAIAWNGDGPTLYLQGNSEPFTVDIVHSGSIDLSSPTAQIVASAAWHCVITRSGSNAAIYVNGVQTVASTTFSVTYTADSQFRIGGSSAFGEWMQGNIDDVIALNRGWSADEVRQWYKLSRAGYPGILLRRQAGYAIPASSSRANFLPLLGVS